MRTTRVSGDISASGRYQGRKVTVGLTGGVRVVGIAEVEPVDRDQIAVGIADLMPGEVAIDVDVRVAVAAGRGGDHAVEHARTLVDVGPFGRAEADAGL